MATETEETPNPENEPTNETAAGTPQKAPAAGARPRRSNARTGTKSTTAKTTAKTSRSTKSAKSEKAPAEPSAETVEKGVVVRGDKIRNDGAETILSSVDVGPAEADTSDDAMASPVVFTTVESITLEDMAPFEDAPDLGTADMIVDMLNGLAEADLRPDSSDAADSANTVEIEVGAPYWYVMSLQVEDAQRAAAANRKAGRLAKKLERQVEKAARLLNDVFEMAATDASVLARHERPIARLIALLEVTPPRDKDAQRMFADIIRTERRALAETVRSTG